MSDYEKPPTKRPSRSMGMMAQIILGAVLLLGFVALVWILGQGHFWPAK